MASAAEVTSLLSQTQVPTDLVERLLDGASATWLMGTPAAVVAADIALCHPPMKLGEVRARVGVTSGSYRWQLGVAVHDRPGLLAATAGVLATHGLSILNARCSSWPAERLALQRVVVESPLRRAADWDAIGADLRLALGQGADPAARFIPTPPVTVSTSSDTGGHTVVSITAPDALGLLWATARWFAENGCNIELALIETAGPLARDTFIVEGGVDPAALAAALEGAPTP